MTDWFTLVFLLAITSWLWGPLLICAMAVVLEGIAGIVAAWRREK